MAYMNQERKALIAVALKKVVPSGWKYTLSVNNNSGITMTIKQAPLDLLAAYRRGYAKNPDAKWAEETNPKPSITYAQVNTYSLANAFDTGTLEIMRSISDALNLVGEPGANYDKSESQSDYFDIGWYTYINIGKWDTPFIEVITETSPVTPMASVAAVVTVKVEGLTKKAAPYAKYLPKDFMGMTPGKKAAATKRAKFLAEIVAA